MPVVVFRATDQPTSKHAALVTASIRLNPRKLSVSQFGDLELCKSLNSIELNRSQRLILRPVTAAETVADFDGPANDRKVPHA
jgi:hypothetical protein